MTTVCPLPEGEAPRGFAAALDRERVRAWIGEFLVASAETRIADLTPCYVRYKEADGALVGWRVELRDASRRWRSWVTVRCVESSRLRAEAESVLRRPSPPHADLRGAATIDGEDVLLLAFPVDRALRDLRRVVRASKVRNLLLRCCPELLGDRERISKRRSRFTVVRYKASRRCVLRWDLGVVTPAGEERPPRPVWFRVHAEPRARVAARAMACARALGVRCPEPLATPHDVLAVEGHLEGAPAESMPEETAAGAGRALARLHAAEPAGGLPRRAPLLEMDLALMAARDLRRLRARLGPLADEVTDRLARRIPPMTRPALLHGDFHRGQVLVGEDPEPGLVDFDRVAIGEPAIDLACYLAHERAAGREATAALLEGYAAAADLPEPATLAWYRSCALLRQAMMPFRELRADWPERAEALVRAAALAAEEALA